jgi:hypothetical protein
MFPLRQYGNVLATRKIGADVAAELRASMEGAEIVIVDFCEIRVASAPFLDELAMGLRAMIADSQRFVLLAHLNEDLVDTLELVLQRRDIVLTTIKPGGALQTVGGSRQLEETLAAAQELQTFTAPQLAEQLELKLPNLHQRLNQLRAAGALTKRDDPTAERGRRHLFQTPTLPELESAAPAGAC